jgi:hypothetical protein
MPFLPRVTDGRAVLSLARWDLSEADLKPLFHKNRNAAFDDFRRLRDHFRLPAVFCLKDDAMEALIDTTSREDVEFLIKSAKQRGGATVVEQFPDSERLCVRGPEGAFVNEFMIPMTRPTSDPKLARPQPAPALRATVERRH